LLCAHGFYLCNCYDQMSHSRRSRVEIHEDPVNYIGEVLQ
jgi:hypothetical protein